MIDTKPLCSNCVEPVQKREHNRVTGQFFLHKGNNPTNGTCQKKLCGSVKGFATEKVAPLKQQKEDNSFPLHLMHRLSAELFRE